MKTIVTFFLAFAFFSSYGQNANEIIQNYNEKINLKELQKQKNITKIGYVSLGIAKSTTYQIYNIETGDFKNYSYTKSLGGQLQKELKMLSSGMGFKFNYTSYTWERMSQEEEKNIKSIADRVLTTIPVKTIDEYDITFEGVKKDQNILKFNNPSIDSYYLYYFDSENNLLTKEVLETFAIDPNTGAKRSVTQKNKYLEYALFDDYYFYSIASTMGIKIKCDLVWFNSQLPGTFFEPDEMVEFGGDVTEEELEKLLNTGIKKKGREKISLK